MALIEKTEFHLVEGEDYYDGESVDWVDTIEEARARLSELGEGHCIVKATHYCAEFETVQ